MWKTSIFRLQVNCPGCNTLHPVSSINYSENCYKCGKYIGLSELFNNQLFGGIVDKERYLNSFLVGTVEQLGGSGVGKAGSYKLTYSSGYVYCEECLNPISDETIQKALDEKTPVICVSCGHSMPIRPATPDMKSFHSKSVAVINDPQGYDTAEKNTDKNQTLVFTCMTCGAGLNLNADTNRNIKCTYCDNDNYLPDSIWIKLHPDKDVQPFFLITDISDDDIKESVEYFQKVTALRVYEKHFNNFTDSLFQKVVMTDALKIWLDYFLNNTFEDKIGANLDISKPRKHFYQQFSLGLDNQDISLKELVAASSSVPEDIQLLLAKDTSTAVRTALAKNPSISKDVIKILRADSDPVVSAEASKRKSGLFGKLFG
ncbi:MAG: hypothetical protein KDC73_13670 [Ignavibacteriae bacterium]|nr:hypothetical protein [Ignavibacteriota bacterium]MCB9244702.1 hypothetical protein [Ignavibacteriales bacterium]